MTREFESSRFRFLNDPPVTTRPFSITVDPDKCIGCSVCVKQCPVQSIGMAVRKAPSPAQQAACQYRCPAGTDTRGYAQLLSKGGSLEDAWRMITQTNPLPAVTGRVCPHPCEGGCNRTGIDGALNIHGLERAVGDFGIEKGLAFPKPDRAISDKVAVVGSGPSGLSCAYHLARLGYGVTLYEADARPGGMLAHAIPRYRLPEAVVDAEIGRILAMGITLKLGVAVGRDVSLDDLKKGFKAVYVAPGAQGSTALGIAGEEGNTHSGLDFLRSVKEKKPLSLGRKVVVVGGGNTAIDAARTARRMGSDVTVLYRRSLSEMPAHREEVDAAMAEGVQFQFLSVPVAAAKNGRGRLTCLRVELGPEDASGRPRPVPVKGSEHDVVCDTVIAAAGQDIRAEGFEKLLGSPWIAADALGATKEKGVFAGGDAATGPGMVSEAIGAGRRAALAMDAFLTGRDASLPVMKEIDYTGVPFPEVRRASRSEEAGLPVEQRLSQPDLEVCAPLSMGQVSSESERCLGCGLSEPRFTGVQYFGKICIACHNCQAVCPQEALTFPHFYKVDKGRFAYDFDYPAVGDGMPNPLQLDRPVPLSQIEDRLTGVEKVLYSRRSVRVYKPDPVPRELISRVIEAGRFAPSAGNCQGWKFTVVTDRQLLADLSASTLRFLSIFTKLYQGKGPGRTALKKALAFIKPNAIDQRPMAALQGSLAPKFGEGAMHCLFNAPAAIFLLSHRMHISEPQLGMGILGQNMVLAAHSLGLGTCYVGFVSNALNLDPLTKKKFGKRLGIEWPYDSVSAVITLGWPAVQVDRPVDREFPRVTWVE